MNLKTEMPPAQIAEKLKKLLCEELGLSSDEMESGQLLKSDFGLDSMRMIEILLLIEEEFSISLFGSQETQQNLQNLDTIESLALLVEKVTEKQSGKAPSRSQPVS